MREEKFKEVAAAPENPNWEKLISRSEELYSRGDDIRGPFTRDYTRILHSMAYRRLKHKTQVFFNINNDHICTRMEHVSHVESVSSTIARYLGLNEELTKAISMGHDLGHAPFGHQGEVVLKKLSKEYLKKDFWHEKNGLRFVEKIELLSDNYNIKRNLNLTYAVRDGILSHCGEVDQNGIFVRNINIGLDEFDCPGKYQAATWEGCVVKMADKIAYLGRDIEDAISLGFLDHSTKNELVRMARVRDLESLNTTVIMHNMIIDIAENSSPDKGICLSETLNEQLNEIKKFNYENIYRNQRLQPFEKYAELVLTEIFRCLDELYDGKHTFGEVAKMKDYNPRLGKAFEKWLAKYCDNSIVPKNLSEISFHCENEKIYGKLDTVEIYRQAIIDFISGMTDRFAIDLFNELLMY